MSWLLYRWFFVFGVSLFVFKGCQSLFLRHSETGKCIAASDELVYNNPRYALPYFVKMTDNCLDNKAEFRYLDSQLLLNIEKNGTLVSSLDDRYKIRWAVYTGVSTNAKRYQQSAEHRLKQTAAGSLFFYSIDRVCAEPDSSNNYLLRNTYCSKKRQQFTFGSITAYNAKMENVHCSPIQRMMVNSADYGDFNNRDTFNNNASIDTQCSKLTNCQVKSLCGGQRSCQLSMDNNFLPLKYCSDTSKQIYTKYTCVDTNRSSAITTAPNIRLTKRNVGFIEIKDGSNWRRVVEENWDKNRQKMLCQHLGFEEINSNIIEAKQLESRQQIASGDLICYNTQPNGTSCCVHLKPSTSTTITKIPHVRCKMCNNPLLHNANVFPDSVFSGSGDPSLKYKDARITEGGWCPSRSGRAYLLLDLQKEYHITQAVIMADKEQTKWSSSYSLKYSHNTSFENIAQIFGNQNGYQASRTNLDIYNVRYMKIESTGNQDFCLRIELCGEAKCADCEIAKKSNREEIRIDLLIPLVISISCFLLSLGVNIYQHRLIQSNNGRQCHKSEDSEQAQQMTRFDPLSNIKRTEHINASPVEHSFVTNDDDGYELPDSDGTEQTQAKPEIPTGQESSTYMSLKDSKEPENVYQSLQPNMGNIAAVEYENHAFTSNDK